MSSTASARCDRDRVPRPEDVLALVRIPDAGPVAGLGLLDSAAGQLRSQAFGDDACPTLRLKAAAPLHWLARSHSLVEGNELVMDVAAGAAHVEEIADRLRVTAR